MIVIDIESEEVVAEVVGGAPEVVVIDSGKPTLEILTEASLATRPGPPGPQGPAGPAGPQGPGGTMILNGDGPPAPDLGDLGDYYTDNAGNTLYGPKSSQTVIDEITTAPFPGNPGLERQDSSYNLSSAFRVNQAGTFFAGWRILIVNAETFLDNWVLRLYDDAGLMLAKITTSVVPGYQDIDLPEPVPLVSGARYHVSIQNPNGGTFIQHSQGTDATSANGFVTFLGMSGRYANAGDTMPPAANDWGPTVPAVTSRVTLGVHEVPYWPEAVSGSAQAGTLDGLTDVNAPAPVEGQVLGFTEGTPVWVGPPETVTESGHYSTEVASNAWDNNPLTTWITGVTQPAWTTADFGSPIQANRLFAKSATMGDNYRLEGSNNATDWTTVVAVVNASIAGNTYDFALASYRYWRATQIVSNAWRDPQAFTLYLVAPQWIATSGGTTIINGEGPPSTALGDLGDFYIDTAPPGALYGPKRPGLWPLALKGAPG